jgi:hypothetical protein
MGAVARVTMPSGGAIMKIHGGGPPCPAGGRPTAEQS